MKNIESGKTRCLKNIKAINNTGMVNEIIQVNILPKYPFLLSYLCNNSDLFIFATYTLIVITTELSSKISSFSIFIEGFLETFSLMLLHICFCNCLSYSAPSLL